MTGILPPSPSTLRSYRLSLYEAGGLRLRVGRRPCASSGAVAARWKGRELVLLSACNPGGRRMPDGWNRRRMTRLAERLRRCDHALGAGRLGCWSEPLVLAAIDRRVAVPLARRFRQNAVILLRDRRPAKLVLLAKTPCGGT